MTGLNIKETKSSPTINLDPQTGKLEIMGFRSMPELSFKFYEPVITWVKEYCQNPSSSGTTMILKLDYFNTTSAKCFMEIFKILDRLAETGHQVHLIWHYEAEDEDMEMSIDDIRASLKFIKAEKKAYDA